MPNVSFNRDSLCFTGRRTACGIEIEADFWAPKLSNPDEGEVCYSVKLIIDPIKRGVKKGEWMGSRQGQEYVHGRKGPPEGVRKAYSRRGSNKLYRSVDCPREPRARSEFHRR